MTRLQAVMTVTLGMVLAACGDNNGIGTATIPNIVDTFTVASLEGGALQAPSAYSIASNNVVRTYETITFDFAYTVDHTGRQLFLPLAVLGLSPGGGIRPGLIKSSADFDAVTKAPLNGYITTDTVVVDSGDVLLVRSTDICISLGVPQYAKLEILSIDPADRTLTFQVVADNNCGYRGLKLGIPKE